MRSVLSAIAVLSFASTAAAESFVLKLPRHTQLTRTITVPAAPTDASLARSTTTTQTVVPMPAPGAPPAAAAATPPATPFFGVRPPTGRPYFGEQIAGAPLTEPTSPQIPARKKAERR